MYELELIGGFVVTLKITIFVRVIIDICFIYEGQLGEGSCLFDKFAESFVRYKLDVGSGIIIFV